MLARLKIRWPRRQSDLIRSSDKKIGQRLPSTSSTYACRTQEAPCRHGVPAERVRLRRRRVCRTAKRWALRQMGRCRRPRIRDSPGCRPPPAPACGYRRGLRRELIAVESRPRARNLHNAWDTAVVYKLEDTIDSGSRIPRHPSSKLCTRARRPFFLEAGGTDDIARETNQIARVYVYGARDPPVDAMRSSGNSCVNAPKGLSTWTTLHGKGRHDCLPAARQGRFQVGEPLERHLAERMHQLWPLTDDRKGMAAHRAGPR